MLPFLCGSCTPVFEFEFRNYFVIGHWQLLFWQWPYEETVRLYKWWELITEKHSVCKNALNLFQFQYLFSYFLGYGRSSITIFHVNVNIYILFIAKRVVGHYGKLVSVKIQ